MQDAPKLSVVMAVYNAAGYVRATIQSVLAQTFRNLEFICVDDGSSDDSVSVLREFERQDPRVKVIAAKHAGACETLNRGLAVARGRYIGFIDNDDLIHPQTFEIALAELERQALDVVVFDRTDFDEAVGCSAFVPIDRRDAAVVIDDYAGWGMGDHHVAFWCKVYRREVIDDVRFEPTITYGDLLFHWKLFAKSGLKVGYMALPLYNYCVRAGSVMHSRITETKAVDKVRALEFISGYVADDSELLERVRIGLFPERVWSVYKVARRQMELRRAVFDALRIAAQKGVFRLEDMPFVRRMKLWLALTLGVVL